MFKLIKWAAGITAVGFVLLYVVFGTSASSYVGAALGKARSSVKESIPIDFEIRRSARLIRQIEPQIRECLRDVAVGEVELEALREGIKNLQKQEQETLARLTHRKRMLEEGQAVYFVAGLKLERSRLERDLAGLFDRYRNTRSLLGSKESLCRSQEKALVAAKRKLEKVLEERGRLQEMLKNLKTQKRQLDALAAQSRRFDLDDSSLAQARTALGEVKKRLDVAQKMLEADFLDLECLDPGEEAAIAGPRRDILGEVNRYLEAREQGESPEPLGENVIVPLNN